MLGTREVLKWGVSFHVFAGTAWLALLHFVWVHLDVCNVDIFLPCANELEIVPVDLFFVCFCAQ